MKRLTWLALIAPITALATNPQVDQNTANIAALQDEQAIQNKQINHLKTQQALQSEAFQTLRTEQSLQASDIGVLQSQQQVQDERITALESALPPPTLSLAAAQIQSALDLTSGLRWLVADHYRRNGTFAADNALAGADAPPAWSNAYVESSTVFNGVIEIWFRNTAAPEIAGGRIFLLPNDPGAAVIWFDCVGDGLTDAYLAELDCLFVDKPHEPLYTIRRQIDTSNDLMAQSSAQQSIQDFYNLNGVWPLDNMQAGLAMAEQYRNRYVDRLEVSGPGTITLTFSDAAHPSIRFQSLIWIPTDNGASIQWDCFSEIPARYLPVDCGI